MFGFLLPESLPPNILEDEVEGNKEDTTNILTESEQPLQTTLLPDNILTAASDAVNNQTPEIASEHSAVSCEQMLVNTDNYTEPGPFNIQDSSLENNDMVNYFFLFQHSSTNILCDFI